MDSDLLSLIKRHCRADDIADPLEDAYYWHLWESALALMVHETGRSEDELEPLPSDLRHATLMVAAHLHDQREGESAQALRVDPYVLAVIKKYEKLSDRDE